MSARLPVPLIDAFFGSAAALVPSKSQASTRMLTTRRSGRLSTTAVPLGCRLSPITFCGRSGGLKVLLPQMSGTISLTTLFRAITLTSYFYLIFFPRVSQRVLFRLCSVQPPLNLLPLCSVPPPALPAFPILRLPLRLPLWLPLSTMSTQKSL